MLSDVPLILQQCPEEGVNLASEPPDYRDNREQHESRGLVAGRGRKCY